MPQHTDASRDAEMAAMYRAGMTLQQIGDEFGVTRERVRQIMRRSDVERGEGGVAVRARRRRARRERELSSSRQARAVATYGCDYDTAMSLNEGLRLSNQSGLAVAFCGHRSRAIRRGVGFELTFPQWVSIWAESGQIHNRGLGVTQYCMCRVGDAGPYAVGNVYIATASQNHRDYWAMAKASAANDS